MEIFKIILIAVTSVLLFFYLVGIVSQKDKGLPILLALVEIAHIVYMVLN